MANIAKLNDKLDDGFHKYLTEGARFAGDMGIPCLLDRPYAQVPGDLIPFEKMKSVSAACAARSYVHFYMHDKSFSRILRYFDRYLPQIERFAGIITPDFTILEGRSPCLQATNTYFNRAVGFHAQTCGISAIPNIRWGDPSTYGFCFLGAREGGVVCVSTHGCMKSSRDKESFYNGLSEMLHRLAPTDVLVHGKMPDDVFGDFQGLTTFRRYPSWFERTHENKVA